MARYEFGKGRGIIPIFVKINDEVVVKMGLDTGATYTLIPWKTAKSLNLGAEKNEIKIRAMTAEGRCEVPLINLNSILVLDKKIENVKAVIHDLPENSHIDGLLGLSFLNHVKLTIDFRNGWLEIE